ncbi:hypothetical protein BLOT_001502 [Blomia tropicalis]|nr:hypothetical protein BLOT_001502 [Blomia tropicalis]
MNLLEARKMNNGGYDDILNHQTESGIHNAAKSIQPTSNVMSTWQTNQQQHTTNLHNNKNDG